MYGEREREMCVSSLYSVPLLKDRPCCVPACDVASHDLLQYTRSQAYTLVCVYMCHKTVLPSNLRAGCSSSGFRLLGITQRRVHLAGFWVLGLCSGA